MFFQALQHRDENIYDTFFRNAFSGSGLVPLHIRIGASLCLIAPPLQVQIETKTCQKTSVRLFQTSSAVDLKTFRKTDWEKDVVYLCQFPLCPSGAHTLKAIDSQLPNKMFNNPFPVS